jgi:hypothetical protein
MPNNQAPAGVMRPEAELLLCCARTQMDAARAERIRVLLQEELDWDYMIWSALRHGMLPLLSWHLNSLCPEAVPKASLDLLREGLSAIARDNLFLTGELRKLLKLFAAHNIPALPFKGPSLAASVYGNLSLRHFRDLDILVHKRDILSAKTLLLSQGYCLRSQLTDAQEAALLQSFHEYTFDRNDGRSTVDLHWRFLPSCFSFPLDLDHIWERLEQVPFAGTTVLSLPPEDLLLILCVHGTKDRWSRLIWICDIAELIRAHWRMDWKRVIAQARTLNSERKLLLGLYLANALLGAALPEEVMQRVQTNPVIKSLAAQVRKGLFSAPDSGSRADLCEGMALHLRVADRLRDRVPYVLYCLRLVITPNAKDQALLPVPLSLAFLYYLLRPIRLVRTYGLRPWKRKNFTPTKLDGVGAAPR